jgi:hypothetical protein
VAEQQLKKFGEDKLILGCFSGLAFVSFAGAFGKLCRKSRKVCVDEKKYLYFFGARFLITQSLVS